MTLVGLMDCNNFFVSCERLFRPDLRKVPVAVLSSHDGCVVARSEEVKRMDIPIGLPLFQVKQLVDTSAITFFSSNFSLYRDISSRVMATLMVEVGAAEVYSIDEAFFTVSETTTKEALVALRARIVQQTGIPVSIGVAPTKTLAKLASKIGKCTDGVAILKMEEWNNKMSINTRLGDVWNLGGATEKILRAHGIETPKAFMEAPQQWVSQQLGLSGRRVQDELCGVSIHSVSPNSATLRQSIASTRSFVTTKGNQSALEAAVTYHVTHVAEKLRTQKLFAQTMIVELRAGRYSDFAHKTGVRTISLPEPTNNTATLLKQALNAMRFMYDKTIPYKKAGVVVSGLLPETVVQRSLFGETGEVCTESAALDQVVDTLNKRFGPQTVRHGTLLDMRPKTNANACSPHYTTVWKDIPMVAAK